MQEKMEQAAAIEKAYSPLQYHAIDALEKYSGEMISCELQVSDIQDVDFMRHIASMDLPVEISIVEGVNGQVKLTTGFDEESTGMQGVSKVAVVDDEINTNRHISGRFSIHTHLESTPYDLTPSPGDVNVNRQRSFKSSSPALIMNEYGFSVVGINPYAKWFAEEIKKDHTYGNDKTMDYLVDRGDWLYNQASAYEHFLPPLNWCKLTLI